MRMAQRMNFNHGGNHVARDKGITHPRGRLHDAIANIANRENGRLSSGFKNSVVHLSNQGLEMKRAGVSHSPRALNQYLWLTKVFFRPVHSQSEGISLVIVGSEFLTAKLHSICHLSFSVSSPPSWRGVG